MKTVVGLVQMRCTDDARKNQTAAEKGIREAARRGARIVCLPELYRGHYFCQTEDYAPPLRENKERLEGERIEVVDLPMPSPMYFAGQRLPASYANFYITNGTVIVPTFNDPADRLALGILAECFPGREVVGFHAVDFVWGLSTVHCATQQEPAG